MTTLERSIELDVPASKAYETWTQFERFPEFMQGVESVEQRDDRHLHWRADVFGRTEEWDAEITEQIPDKRIAWRSQGGATNAGVVTFHRIDDERSRVMLQLEYRPERFIERMGDALGILDLRVSGDLERFKRFVEEHADAIEGWRGRIPARPDAAQETEPAEAGAPATRRTQRTLSHLKIRDLMTGEPAILEADATVADAAAAMRERDVGDVLVRESGHLRGIVTDRDLVVRCIAEHLDPGRQTLGELCSKELATIESDASVDEALGLMEERAVRRLPVVESGAPVGIVSLGDLARVRDPGSPLGRIADAPPNR